VKEAAPHDLHFTFGILKLDDMMRWNLPNFYLDLTIIFYLNALNGY